MAGVTVKRRVRPLRFAFLVDHRSADELRKAIQINTILWGGTKEVAEPSDDPHGS